MARLTITDASDVLCISCITLTNSLSCSVFGVLSLLSISSSRLPTEGMLHPDTIPAASRYISVEQYFISLCHDVIYSGSGSGDSPRLAILPLHPPFLPLLSLLSLCLSRTQTNSDKFSRYGARIEDNHTTNHAQLSTVRSRASSLAPPGIHHTMPGDYRTEKPSPRHVHPPSDWSECFTGAYTFPNTALAHSLVRYASKTEAAGG